MHRCAIVWLVSVLLIQCALHHARVLDPPTRPFLGHKLSPADTFAPYNHDGRDSNEHPSPGSVTGRNVTRRRVHGYLASNEEWERLKSKGCAYLGAMGATDSEAGKFFPGSPASVASLFKSYDELNVWGYTEDPAGIAEYQAEGGGPHIDAALRAYGLKVQKSDAGGLVCMALKHTNPKTIEGQEYRKTNAEFRTLVNPNDGVLVGWYKYSPQFKGSIEKPPVTVFPKLKSWSDVAFLQYRREAQRRGVSANNLRYIISASIMNSETDALLARALADNPDDAPNLESFEVYEDCAGFGWDNRTAFNMDSSAGKVLLASPNGRGAAFMLIQRKSVLGQKTTISKVEVWCHEMDEERRIYPELNFLFHVSPN